MGGDNKIMERYYKPIIAVLSVVIIVLVGVIVSLNSKRSPAAQNGNPAGTSTILAASTTSSTPVAAPKKGTVSTAPASPARPVISFITPVAGDLWKIGTYNPISWTEVPGVTGYIYLVDAASGDFVGVIIPQTGAQQTSYSWNTRDLLLSRTNPLKKDVTPGSYIIEMAFDANHLPLIASPAFTITQ
jgi:hypothetical protein